MGNTTPSKTPNKAPGRPKSTERNTRSRAIAAAQALLIKGGYSEMSMERVAKRIGIRTPSLYHHFPGGKQELLLALVEQRTIEDSNAISRLIEQDDDPIEQLRATAQHFASRVGRYPYHTITEARKHLSKKVRNALQRKFAERVEAPLVQIIKQGISKGHIRRCDPLLAVRAFLVLMIGLGEFEADERARAKLPDFLVDIFAEGIRIRD